MFQLNTCCMAEVIYMFTCACCLIQHCYVPEKIGHGLIVPLLKDKQDNQSRSDMYGGVTLSPTIVKLFEYISMEFCGDQLSSDVRQFGFKKQSGCCHALFTFKNTTKYLLRMVVKYIVPLLMRQKHLTRFYIMVNLLKF